MSKPEIYPIYWSSAQMEARQHPRMAAVQAFLNSQWTAETDGQQLVRPGGRLASTPTGSAAARRAPTPAAWAPTSTPAPSTCG